MADHNLHRAGNFQGDPHRALGQLARLLGEWDISSSFLTGTSLFRWVVGGFFLFQEIDALCGDRTIKGTEYIGFDEHTQILRSHFVSTNGANFTYTWEVDDDSLHIWFGEKDSDNFFVGHFAPDDLSYHGEWRWPAGGYPVTMTRRTT